VGVVVDDGVGCRERVPAWAWYLLGRTGDSCEVKLVYRSMREGATEQDKFFTQLRSSPDGFGVVAEFFGRGMLNPAVDIEPL
jgi:Vacuolar protein sorting protein 11 C terminal